MGIEKPEFQVVFLIDLWQRQANENEQTAISLGVFRVLTYLFSKIQERGKIDEKCLNKSHEKLKWGCKFFNSREHKGKIERSQFKSFKLKHFEVFEKEVEKRLKTLNQTDSNCVKNIGDNVDGRHRRVSHGYKAKSSTPAHNVGRVLSEVFADFQWEGPDLMSPGRPHRRKSRPARWGHLGLNTSREGDDIAQTQLRNLLFVYSKCPCNEESLKLFCGMKCMDGDVFLDSVLSTSMLEKLRGNLRLDLYWVDTGNVVSEETADPKSIQKVSQALDKVGGKLIPFDAILQMQRGILQGPQSLLLPPPSINITGTTAPDSYEVSNRLTQTSVSLDHYLYNNGARSSSKRKSLEKKLPEQCTQIAGQLFMDSGAKDIYIGKLKFQTLLNNTTSPSQRRKEPKKKYDDSNINSTSMGKTCCGLSWNQLTDEDLSKYYNFCAIGAIKMNGSLTAVCSRGLQFICCEEDDNATKPSSYLPKLISAMTSQQIVMLVSMTTLEQAPSQWKPCLSILQPLTPRCAQLTVLSTSQILQLEKQLLSPHISASGEITECPGFEEWQKRFITNKTTPRLLSETKPAHCTSAVQTVEPFNCTILERWYPAGRSTRMASLLEKLSDRVNSFDFLNGQEKALLKQVQKIYRRENQPILQCQYEEKDQLTKFDSTNTDIGKTNVEEEFDEVDGEVGKIVFLERLRSMSKIITGSRSEKMLKSGIQISKKTSSSTVTEDEDRQEQQHRHKPIIADTDFRNEKELVDYLLTVYEKTLVDCGSVDTCVQSIVMVALHFLKESGADNPGVQLNNLLNEKLSLNNSKLRQKHQSDDCQLTEDQKLLEYKIQIQLKFEIAANQGDLDSMSEDTIEEICNMLRKWSLSGKLDIRRYLEESLVVNYIHTLPKSLGSLYQDLMLPMPDELAKLVPKGDNSSLEDSCLSDHLSPSSSVGPSRRSNPPSLSQQPLSDRSDILTSANFKTSKLRKLAMHPSLSDIGPKRQIMVAANPAHKKRTKSRRTKGPGSARKTSARKGSARKGSARKGSARKSSARKGSAKKGSARKSSARKLTKESSTDGDVKAVRRNLFMSGNKLERRQSVAVMENLSSPKRHKSQRKGVQSSPSPKGNVPNLVAETPTHKQRITFWKRKDNISSRTPATVIEESPMKASKSPHSTTSLIAKFSDAKSPAKSQLPLLSSKRSFYSAGPQSRSRNLEKYRKLADRLAGPTPTGASQLKSPDRLFVVKQLKGSPSPSYSLRRTPRKLDRTPVKSAIDSPSQNTRSKTPSRAPVPELVLYRESPKTTGRTPKQSVTRKLALTLTPEKVNSHNNVDGTVVVPSSPNNILCTPKRPLNVTISSPSQNTRSQVGIKPKAGVRSLSFDKQPTKENQSLSHVTVIQSTPVKQIPDIVVETTPQKTPSTPTHKSPNSNPRTCRQTPPTPASILKKRPVSGDQLQTPQKSAHKVHWNESRLETFDTGQVSVPPNASHRVSLVKTPTKSPRKTKVRTPDFDSWRRRKPRFGSSISPKQTTETVSTKLISQQDSVKKSPLSVKNVPSGQTANPRAVKSKKTPSKENSSLPKIYDSVSLKPEIKQVNLSRSPENRNSNIEELSSQNINRPVLDIGPRVDHVKELSPTYVPNNEKKRKLSCDFEEENSSCISKKQCLLGKFQISDSSNTPKDSDVATSNYFSVANQEVFISAESISDTCVNSPDQSDSTSPFSVNHSPRFTRVHSLKRFTDVLSSESESAIEAVDSPLFGSLRTDINGPSISTGRAVTETTSPSTLHSPKSVKNVTSTSPNCLKSYSPNVSAKGLFNLMNSPLIRSGQSKRLRPVTDGEDAVVRFTAEAEAPSKRRKTARSRRSLNLLG